MDAASMEMHSFGSRYLDHVVSVYLLHKFSTFSWNEHHDLGVCEI